MTICAKCANFRGSLSDKWYDQYCGAEGAKLPACVDPVTGREGFGRNGQSDTPYQCARKVNTSGACKFFEGGRDDTRLARQFTQRARELRAQS